MQSCTRFRLCTLFILIVVLAAPLSWRTLAIESHIKGLQHVRNRGAYFYCSRESAFISNWIESKPSFWKMFRIFPKAVQERLLIEYQPSLIVDAATMEEIDTEAIENLYGVFWLGLYDVDDRTDLRFLQEMPYLSDVAFYGGHLAKHQIETLATIEGLESLDFWDVKVDPESLRILASEIPQAEVAVVNDEPTLELAEFMNDWFAARRLGLKSNNP